VTANVSQQRVSGQPFTVDDLHQFVDQANLRRLPDHTLVVCTADRSNSIFSLTTHATGDPDTDSAPVTPKPGEINQDLRTIIKRNSTGPVKPYRHWLRSYAVHDLILGDVRALLAQSYEAGLPVDNYEITALTAPGSDHRVFSLSARPRPKDR
jgi:hypothetical protein